ncbi:MAG: alpha/beta hydrolase [Solirubrobacteraceae bacterium]
MQERVDRGGCKLLHHDGDAGRCAVLLPGRFYPTRAPALWFAREAVMAQGWSAIEVLGEPGEHPDPLGWERARFERALEAAGAALVLVIGKSLASMFAAEVSERGLPAVWLTPLLSEASVIAGLERASRATLLVGGTADAAWRVDAIPDNPLLEALELPGVDHGVQVGGDPLASLSALRQVTESVIQLAARI